MVRCTICSWLQHPPLHIQFCIRLFVCVCVPWFNRTFPGELSAFGGQTVCCPLRCLCRELVLWEQLFREQILINERMLEVFVWLSTWCPTFLSILFLCLSVSCCCNAVFSKCGLTFGISRHRARPALTSWLAVNLAANKTPYRSQNKIQLRAVREHRKREIGVLGPGLLLQAETCYIPNPFSSPHILSQSTTYKLEFN